MPPAALIVPVPATEALRILHSARSPTPDPRLGDLLNAFRHQWTLLAQRRYPRILSEFDDVVQECFVKLTDSSRLAALRNPHRLDAWARSIFVHAVLDALRIDHPPLADETHLAALPSAIPTPEEHVLQRQRVDTILRCLDGIDVARLKFLDGLPDHEIARRCHLTRDGVAGRLKRIRKQIHAALVAAEERPRPQPGGAS